MILVDVVYAQPLGQDCCRVTLTEGATVGEAIKRSGVLDRHPGIDLDATRVGIWGRRCGLATIVRDGDRVEIYRSLQADPKEVRRQRAVRAQRKAP